MSVTVTNSPPFYHCFYAIVASFPGLYPAFVAQGEEPGNEANTIVCDVLLISSNIIVMPSQAIITIYTVTGYLQAL